MEDSSYYPDEKVLWRAVEKELRRSLSPEDWALVAPCWSGPYGPGDLEEIVQAMRDTVPPQSSLPPKEKVRQFQLARFKKTTLQAKEMVATHRKHLFGHEQPPFPDGRDAADWIESQVQEPGTMHLRLEVILAASGRRAGSGGSGGQQD